jgi:hypothetical protein
LGTYAIKQRQYDEVAGCGDTANVVCAKIEAFWFGFDIPTEPDIFFI